MNETKQKTDSVIVILTTNGTQTDEILSFIENHNPDDYFYQRIGTKSDDLPETVPDRNEQIELRNHVIRYFKQ